jgi:hypothetical protein
MSAAAIVIAGDEGFRAGAVPLPERCFTSAAQRGNREHSA